MTKMKLNDKEILIPKEEKQTPIVVKKASHTLIAMKPVEKKKDHSLYVSLVSKNIFMLLFFLFLWLCPIETQFRCFLTFLTILTVFSSTSIVFKKLEIAELLLYIGALFSGSFFIVAMIQPNIIDGEILQMNLQYQFLVIKVFCCFVVEVLLYLDTIDVIKAENSTQMPKAVIVWKIAPTVNKGPKLASNLGVTKPNLSSEMRV